MPVLLHGGMICPLEVAGVLSVLVGSMPVVVYFLAKVRRFFR